MRARRSPVALLWAVLLLGGCDGGLFGTGDASSDAGPVPVDAGPGPSGVDAAADTVDGGDEEVDGDASSGTAEGEPPTGTAPDAGAPGTEASGAGASGADTDDASTDGSSPDDGFVNAQVAHDRGVPLVRGVNLTRAAVRVVARGAGAAAEAAFAVAPGTAGAAVAIDAATDVLVVVDARSSGTLAEVAPVSLGASTLTTLVVFPDAGDGVRAVPLATRADAPAGGVANVRAILADGSDGGGVGGIGLRPAGDDPGGAGIDFAPVGAGSIESDYASAAPGDYELVRDGEGNGDLVSLEAGLTYSLVLGRDAGAGVLTIVDGDLDDGAP